MAGIGISVENLRKNLKGISALDDVSVSLSPGILHGIIGPDGAGKTTLFRTIVGLLKPDSGTVAFSRNGTAVSLAQVRSEIAYMPQQQSLYPDLSVDEHLEFFRELYGVPAPVYRARRERLLKLTRLAAFTERPAGKLSGGMYKKLGLMCSLLQSPGAVLLDEPTNGVDPISRREFWELLYSLTGEGILVLVSTSYMDEAERCGRVHVMESGRLLASGEPRQVLLEAKAATFEDLFLRKSGATR